jgi:excisionase family DNA binding protein
MGAKRPPAAPIRTGKQHPYEFAVARKLYTPDEVAEISGFHRQVIYRAIRRGDLRAFRVCSRIRIKGEDLEEWIEREPAAAADSQNFHTTPVARASKSGSFRLIRDHESEGGRS